MPATSQCGSHYRNIIGCGKTLKSIFINNLGPHFHYGCRDCPQGGVQVRIDQADMRASAPYRGTAFCGGTAYQC